MEKFPQYNEAEQLPLQPVEVSDLQKEKNPSGSVSRFIKKHAGLAAVVGLGYFGGMQEGQAGETNSFHAAKSEYPNAEQYEIQKIGSAEDGKNGIYTVKDLESGKIKKFTAKSDKEASEIGPEYVKPLTPYELAAVRTEQELQRSGLVAPANKESLKDKKSITKTHVEDRSFKGDGIDVKTKVEVDEAGNVVKLVDAEW